MTEKQLEKFKEVIYDPYTEAWAIIKEMRDANRDDKFWQEYNNKCYEFRKKYPSEIGGSIYRLLLDAGSEVARIESMQL